MSRESQSSNLERQNFWQRVKRASQHNYMFEPTSGLKERPFDISGFSAEGWDLNSCIRHATPQVRLL